MEDALIPHYIMIFDFIFSVLMFYSIAILFWYEYQSYTLGCVISVNQRRSFLRLAHLVVSTDRRKPWILGSGSRSIELGFWFCICPCSRHGFLHQGVWSLRLPDLSSKFTVFPCDIFFWKFQEWGYLGIVYVLCAMRSTLACFRVLHQLANTACVTQTEAEIV